MTCKIACNVKPVQPLGNGISGVSPGSRWMSVFVYNSDGSSSFQNIEEIVAGEMVWACDAMTGQWQPQVVTAPLAHEYSGDIITVTVGGSVVEATGNHPFWVVAGEGLESRSAAEHVYDHERDMTANGRWIDARDLQVGDALLSQHDSSVIIVGLSTRQETTWVYNIHVAGMHTYAVGTDALLVHNRPDGVPPFPKKGDLKKVSDYTLQQNGIDPHTIKEGYGGAVSRFDVYKDSIP